MNVAQSVIRAKGDSQEAKSPQNSSRWCLK